MNTCALAVVKGTLLIACTVIGIAFLGSCSVGGATLLHNASGGVIEVTVFNYRYQLADGVTQEVRIDSVFGNHGFSIRTSSGLLCYTMPAVDSQWIKPGFFHAKVLGLLDTNGKIYLFSPDSNESDFYKRTSPVQPTHFPLEPTVKDAC